MYCEMLAAGDTSFEDGIDRSFPRFRSKRLDGVVTALKAVQNLRNAQNLQALYKAMHDWRTNESKEFANRGGTDGVAYRLWMEAKQTLKNLFHQPFPESDPPKPPACPGDVILGIYVPEGEGHTEICHGFAYRWAIAAGKIAENPILPARKGFTSFNGPNADPVLYPAGHAGYPAARAGGAMQLQAGDIVAMYLVVGGTPSLGHSLIAETPTTWFSANNAGTFGVGTGRSRIDTTQNFGTFAGHQVGWVGNGNQWMRPDGVAVDVVYRRIP